MILRMGSYMWRQWERLVRDQPALEMLQVVLWSLSVAGDDERLQREIADLCDALNEVFARPDAIDAALALLRYLVATHVALGAPRIAKLLEKVARKGQKEVKVDVLDELKREGREEGKREGRREGERKGRREGRAQTLLELLAARFGPVPAEAKAQILASTEATLARWSLQVLTAPTLAAVLGSAVTKPAKAAAPTRRPSARKRARAAT